MLERVQQCLDPHDDNMAYLYCPKTLPAMLFAILFGLSTIAHVVQAIVYRKKFCWVIIMAGLWETAGFSIRVVGTLHPQSEAFATPQQLIILLSPLWVNAFAYMILGRMVLYFVPEQAVWGIKARRLTLLFVLLDVTAFVVQATGGVILSGTDNPPKLVKIGLDIYKGGIITQESFVVLFIAISIAFQRKVSSVQPIRTTSWRPLLYVLYGVLILITIRIIYRLAEFNGGLYSHVSMTEYFFYILEATPMFLALFLFNVVHPGRILVGPESEFPKKEKKVKGKKGKKGKKGDVESQDFGNAEQIAHDSEPMRTASSETRDDIPLVSPSKAHSHPSYPSFPSYP